MNDSLRFFHDYYYQRAGAESEVSQQEFDDAILFDIDCWPQESETTLLMADYASG